MNTNMVTAVASAFKTAGDVVSIKPYGNGHINDTYCVTTNQSGTPVRYILQRINHDLFQNVPALMQNIQRVCEHAKKRLSESHTQDPDRRALTLIPTIEEEAFLKNENNYWRMYRFIENAVGFDIIENKKQAFEAAKAFGAFQASIADLPGGRLHETIPDFHNTRKRLQALEHAVESDPAGRRVSCQKEITWALDHKYLADSLLSLWEEGQIPERITHNDTKLNNVLIDKTTDEAVCVIDLDTVMPGLALYDFGDMVRTSTSPVAEDEQDICKVEMQLPMFKALVQGYLVGTAGMLNQVEVENLPTAGMVITYTIGIRFLTDYLLGDVYFKTHRGHHNLERCRTQFALLASMQQQLDQMRSVVAECSTQAERNGR